MTNKEKVELLSDTCYLESKIANAFNDFIHPDILNKYAINVKTLHEAGVSTGFLRWVSCIDWNTYKVIS